MSAGAVCALRAHYFSQWVFFFKDLIESVLFARKLIRTCVVGYSSPLILMYNPAVPSDQDTLLASFNRTLILSPSLLVDCSTASKMVRICRDAARDEAKRWEDKEPDVSDFLLYDARILQAGRLYQVISIIRWLRLRKAFERFKLGGAEYGKVLADNWQRIVKQVE